MEKEAIVFVKQLINSLERKLGDLGKAKEENDPRGFNDLKKECFEIQRQIEDLIK
jgi:hypothetical protein